MTHQLRSYDSYDSYVKHQKSKLYINRKSASENSSKMEQYVCQQFGAMDIWRSKPKTLCLGARLGGEVIAFKKLGADAIGIDLNPGDNNKHVIQGDFHDLKFEDQSFDILYSNSMDHVLYLDKFLDEACRVLKMGGLFILDIDGDPPAEWECLDVDLAMPEVLKDKRFNLQSESQNTTEIFQYRKFTTYILMLI